MNPAPILVLAYNRPDKVRDLINSIRPHKPKIIIFSLDGPKEQKAKELEKTELVRDEISRIDWDCNVVIQVHQENVGLRRNIIDAVTQTLTDYDRVIVIEDDVIIGPQFFDFMNLMLERFELDESIMHISGYTVLPKSKLNDLESPFRLTKYPQSIAWATWRSAWNHLDEEIQLIQNWRFLDLSNWLGSKIAALIWMINFSDARNERISTWAYRWIGSVWANRGLVLSPNSNLVSYAGYEVGSHAKSKPTWQELPIDELKNLAVHTTFTPKLDETSERWLGKTVYRETLGGLVRGLIVLIIRTLRPERH